MRQGTFCYSGLLIQSNLRFVRARVEVALLALLVVCQQPSQEPDQPISTVCNEIV